MATFFSNGTAASIESSIAITCTPAHEPSPEHQHMSHHLNTSISESHCRLILYSLKHICTVVWRGVVSRGVLSVCTLGGCWLKHLVHKSKCFECPESPESPQRLEVRHPRQPIQPGEQHYDEIQPINEYRSVSTIVTR